MSAVNSQRWLAMPRAQALSIFRLAQKQGNRTARDKLSIHILKMHFNQWFILKVPDLENSGIGHTNQGNSGGRTGSR
jgi:hypothetical protein